jgi:hypothetical protein
VSQRKLLDAGDLDEATLAVFIARDMPGTPWTDPAAHGADSNAPERSATASNSAPNPATRLPRSGGS